jgi:hypothetical protein
VEKEVTEIFDLYFHPTACCIGFNRTFSAGGDRPSERSECLVLAWLAV